MQTNSSEGQELGGGTAGGFALRLTPSWSGSRPGKMFCTKLTSVRLYGGGSQMRMRRNEWATNRWILRHALSFYLLHTSPHCSASPTFLCQFQQSQRCCWQQVQPLISWHPFILEGVKQMELQSDGTSPGPQGRADGGEINRSDASDGMA